MRSVKADQALHNVDYGEALQKSMFFYSAQRSGKLPANFVVDWRGDSAIFDGQKQGVDLVGGFYDAGDHVKFGFPMAATLTMLAWGGLVYQDGYARIGQWERLLSEVRWGTDYIIKAHTRPNELWGQVGNGGMDHAWWGPAEVMMMDRPAYKIDEKAPGSDLAAESAAALAAASILFRDEDPAYSDKLLIHARQLYQFADQYRGKYSDSIKDAQAFYNSWSGYQDELVWGALWLYKATGEQAYRNKALQEYMAIPDGKLTWTQNWDDKTYGSLILLSQITDNSQYRSKVESWLDYWTVGNSFGRVHYTPGGLAWLDQWGSLRYVANTAFLAFVYSDELDAKGLSPEKERRYREFAESQINYILGDNPRQSSYVVGVGNNSPLNVHHRTAHGSWADSINLPGDNRHVLYGALVGGPDRNDDYADQRTDYVKNEVALDYNAGFSGALAKMVELYGGQSLPDFPRSEERQTEFFVSAKVNAQGTNFTEISAKIHNQSAWPATAPQLSFRYFVDLSEIFDSGYKTSDVNINTNYNQGGTVSELKAWDQQKNIYFVEVSFPAGTVTPAGQSHSAKEVQFRLSLPSHAPAGAWKPSNDWSFEGLVSGQHQVATKIAVYKGGTWVFGGTPGESVPPNTGTLCVQAPAVVGLTSADLRPISAGSLTFQLPGFGQAVCQTVSTGLYTVMAPEISKAQSKFRAAPVQVSIEANQTQTAVVKYLEVETTPSTATLCIEVDPTSGISGSDLRAISAGPYSFSVTEFDRPVCRTVSPGSYTINAPEIAKAQSKFRAAPIQLMLGTNQTQTAVVKYAETETTPTLGTLCVEIDSTDGLPRSDLRTISVGTYSYSISEFDRPVCQKVLPGAYTVQAPDITISEQTFRAQAVPVVINAGQTTSAVVSYVRTNRPDSGPQACLVRLSIARPWPAAGKYHTVINFFVQNHSQHKIAAPWTITADHSNYSRVVSSWNWSVKASNGQVAGVASFDWETLQPNGGNTVNVGLIVEGATTDFIPASVKLNQTVCKIIVE